MDVDSRLFVSTDKDLPYFDTTKIEKEPIPHYVAWIDLMGTTNLMRQSIYRAAILVGKMHDAILSTKQTLQNSSLVLSSGLPQFHPLVDGCYIVSLELYPILIAVTEILVRYAAMFWKEYVREDSRTPRWCRLAVPRAAISCGRMYTSREMKDGFHSSRNYARENTYLTNILVGNLLGQANTQERKCSPFGVSVTNDLRAALQSPMFSESNLAPTMFLDGKEFYWYCWRDRISKQAQNLKYQYDSSEFGKAICQFFEEERMNLKNGLYPSDKHEEYIKSIVSYFRVRQDENLHN